MTSKFLKTTLAIAIIIIVAVGYLYLTGKTKFNNGMIEETAETKGFPMGENIKTEPQENKTTETETTGWKTYKNEEYGFEVKYPETISITPVASHEGAAFTLMFRDKPFSPNEDLYLWIDIAGKSSWISCNTYDGFNINGVINIGQNSYDKCIGNDGKQLNTSIVRNNYNFRFISNIYNERNTQINQILSTFKFTE